MAQLLFQQMLHQPSNYPKSEAQSKAEASAKVGLTGLARGDAIPRSPSLQSRATHARATPG